MTTAAADRVHTGVKTGVKRDGHLQIKGRPGAVRNRATITGQSLVHNIEPLHAISQTLEFATPQEIVRWAVETYGTKLTMATAFGPEGCCLLDMIARVRDEIGVTPDIFNLDTGYQFAETLELRERIQERYSLFIRLVSAPESVEQLEARHGGPLYGTDPDFCCRLRKVVPLERAVQGFEAWMTAIRREQTRQRASAPIVGPEHKFEHLVKINPLANWTKTQVWDYIHERQIPINPLHAQGYPSIGCWPCTRPVAAGDDDRAGRWAGTNKKECGIHQ
jgi:phosphoadenosine phosphosulfate reductase